MRIASLDFLSYYYNISARNLKFLRFARQRLIFGGRFGMIKKEKIAPCGARRKP
jgi:hypothetical protein